MAGRFAPLAAPPVFVDNVIAAVEPSHPHLATQRRFYVEISPACDRAEQNLWEEGRQPFRLRSQRRPAAIEIHNFQPRRGS